MWVPDRVAVAFALCWLGVVSEVKTCHYGSMVGFVVRGVDGSRVCGLANAARLGTNRVDLSSCVVGVAVVGPECCWLFFEDGVSNGIV